MKTNYEAVVELVKFLRDKPEIPKELLVLLLSQARALDNVGVEHRGNATLH